MSVQTKALLKLLLLAVVVFGVIAAAGIGPVAWELYRREYGPPRQTVPGTEEVYEGTVADSAMSVVEQKDCKFICTCESRPYIGIVLKDGSGVLFWESDRCEEEVPAFRDDVVRIETAVEEATGFRVATKITVLEKVSF